MSNTLLNYFKKKENSDSPASPAPKKIDAAAAKCDTPKSATSSALKTKQEPLSSKKAAANKENVNKFKMSDKENDKENAKIETKMEVDSEDEEIIRPVVSQS
jgi:hypothetical protein